MPSKIPQTTIRIEEPNKSKLNYIADYYKRSTNQHINYLIERDIELFENIYGKINISENEQ